VASAFGMIPEEFWSGIDGTLVTHFADFGDLQ
jgi:hypothetical protein